MKEFGVSMNILGLRGLQSPGILPVKKAFLQFNLKSMVPPALGTSLENIRTEPRMAGSDPTLNTLIEFKAPLPVDVLFCPRMACSVFDNIAMGYSQPLIGTFTIPIGDLMHELIKERKEESEALANVVAQIKKYVSGEMVAASFRNLIKTKVDDENQRIEQELEEQRVKQAVKDQIAKKLSIKNGDDGSRVSINESGRDFDNQPLLSGDADEEIRQSVRVAEAQKAGIEGSNERLGADMIQSISDNLNNKVQAASNPQPQVLNLNSEQLAAQRANSILNKNRVSSSGSLGDKTIDPVVKFDPKLKRELLDQQSVKNDRARRDTEDARKKAEILFKTA